jgi:hypothetical protein
MDSIRPLKFLSIILSILAAASIISYGLFNVRSTDLNFLFQVFPWYAWVILFSSYAISRIMDVFLSYKQWHTEFITASMAIWLWSLVFVSSSVVIPMDSTSLFYFIPIVIEVWVLSRLVDRRKAA